MAERVAVFIDYQNVYMQARRAFGTRLANGSHLEPSSFGQVHPGALGLWLTSAKGSERTLVYVQVYRGLPSSSHDPKGYGAARRQIEFWGRQPQVKVIAKPLRYMTGIPPREKGIDVALAVDLVMGARDVDCDTAVVFSADTDLVPALDAAQECGRSVEVACWQPPIGKGHRQEIRPSTGNSWSHRLQKSAYDSVCDPTDYNQPVRH